MPANDGGTVQPPADGGLPFDPHNPDGQDSTPDGEVMHDPSSDDGLDCWFPDGQPWAPEQSCTSQIRWQHTITNGEPEQRPNFVAVDRDGNIYWMLTMFGLIQLGGREIGDPYTQSVLLISYTAGGALRWVFDVYDASSDAFALSDTQACIGIGSASSGDPLPSELDPDLGGIEGVVCVSLDGQPRWSRRLNSLLTTIHSMTFDGEGNLYVGGHYQGELTAAQALAADSHDTSEPALKGDGFVASYTADGAPRWLTTMGGPHNDEVLYLAGLRDGRVAVVGEHAESFEIGAGPTPDLGPNGSQGHAAFVALLDEAGALEWAVRGLESGLRAEETQRPSALMIDAFGRIIVAYEYGYNAIAYDTSGQVTQEYAGVADGWVTASTAHRDGFAMFSSTQYDQDVVATVTSTDRDFAQPRARVLIEKGDAYEGPVGFNGVAVAPDGSLIVAGDWGGGLYHRIVVLEP